MQDKSHRLPTIIKDWISLHLAPTCRYQDRHTEGFRGLYKLPQVVKGEGACTREIRESSEDTYSLLPSDVL